MLKCLVGSHNYNLNDENSDKDWKIFLYPTFDNLYKGTNNTKPTTITDIEDIETKDIRQLINLFYKCNPAYFEILFSKEVEYNEQLEESEFYKYIMKNRGSIIFHNLPKFYASCMGTFDQKRKSLLKGTSGTQHLMEKYGYDVKAGVHAYRNLDIVEKLVEIINIITTYNLLSENAEYILKSTYEDTLRNIFRNSYIVESIYSKVIEYNNYFENDSHLLALTDNLFSLFIEDKNTIKYLIKFMNSSFDTIWEIKNGKYTYKELLDILYEKEQRVKELKNHEIFDKKYVNFEVLEKAEEILQKEILENIIKSNIRVEKKFSEDIKENEKYLLRIDSKEQEDVYDEDIDGEWEEIQYTHNISHLIKLKEPVKNDIHKSIHPYMSKTELEKE